MEEDLKVLEELIESYEPFFEQYGKSPLFLKKEKQALENLIKGYRMLKENKITYERVRDIQEENKRIVTEKYIPTSKIKEKITEIGKEYAEDEIDCETYSFMKEILQELMENK